MASRISRALRDLNGLVSKASRGSLGTYVINAPHEWGQPMPQVALSDVYGLITPDRMREIVIKTPTAGAVLNATMDFTQGVKVCFRNRDPSKPANPYAVAAVEEFVSRPNPEDTWLDLFKTYIRDMFTLGYAAFEIERDPDGKPANLWPLDAGKLRIDYDEHGTILGYDMWSARGIPIHGKDGVHAFLPGDVIFFRRDPVSYSRYPVSRIEQLFTVAVIEDLMLYYISTKFTDSNVPFGVFDMGDITDDELKRAIGAWNAQAQNAQHKITLTSSKGMKWFPFNFHLRDLEAPSLLAEARRKIMAIVGVTENEMGESQDVNKSNGYNLSFTFKKRAVEPILDAFISTFTRRFLWDELSLTDLEAYYEPIDSRDELLEAQIDQVYFDCGVATINQIRNRRGDPNVPGGDMPYVKTSGGYIPVHLLNDFAEAQLAALKAVVLEAENPQGAGGSNLISAPLVRAPAIPDRTTTPDGSGSETVKVRYPRPHGATPARGVVEANQRAGFRKDDQNGYGP